MGTTLVVNPGSSSRKYALYDGDKLVLDLRLEHTSTGYELFSQEFGCQSQCEVISQEDFRDAFARVAKETNAYLDKQANLTTLDAIAIRIVAPGTCFQQHAVIDDIYVHNLKKRETSAPLHIPVALKEINQARKYFPDTKLVATSDSAFHRSMPAQAREYSLSKADSSQHDIYRFGYHGLSVASIVRKIHSVVGQDPARMIVCHIGNGVSVTAVKDGKSVDTTMSFSPVSGVPMGSRMGDLDAAGLLQLMRVKNLRPNDAEIYINTNGGLFGLAGVSDIRKLLDLRTNRDGDATKALDIFVYHLQKAIAGQIVALGGLDVLVLTATASVRSSALRSLILRGLEPFGIKISEDRNDGLIGKDGVISVRNGAVKVVVMRTDEMGEMVKIVEELNRALI